MTRNEWGYSTGVNELIAGQDRSTSIASAKHVTVHFGDVPARCEEFILDSQEVVGAVAWVRSPRLLRALAGRPVSLIVNKEFALRHRGSKERTSLDGLRGGVRGFEAHARCVGDCSRGAFTGLMHHKFLVRLERGGPVAVWTGSFNLTSGAGGNFENAVEIADPKVAAEFFVEFARLYEISEPLDFQQGAPAVPKGRKVTVRTGPVKTVKKPVAKKTAATKKTATTRTAAAAKRTAKPVPIKSAGKGRKPAARTKRAA